MALFHTIDSTHRVGVDLLGARPGSPCWILAFHQSAGRGRYGRHWVSPSGAGVYASYVLAAHRAVVPALPQLVGVALCEALSSEGFSCRLKWPNDLLLAGKKLGGILLQTRGAGETVSVVASFGVNHSLSAQDLPRRDSTSLRLAGAGESLSLSSLTCALAERVEEELTAHAGSKDGVEEVEDAILERYRGWSVHELGDRLAVRCGAEVYEGEFAGFATSGELRLRYPGGERLMSSGEVDA